MPRIRSIKPDFFRDEDIAKLSYQTRLLYAGLWTQADKEGRLEDRPERLKVEIFPYDKINIEKLLEELSSHKKSSDKPFIIRYEVEGDKFIQILNWHKHQKPHFTEAESGIPPIPPLYINNKEGKGREVCQEHTSIKQPIINGYLTFKTEVFSLWNDLCKNQPRLTTIREITPSRALKLKTRYTEPSFRDFKAIIEAIPSQSFLLGDNNRRWKVTFDWLIENDTNYIKVLECRYKDHEDSQEGIKKFFKKE